MNFDEILAALKQASSFDLFCRRAMLAFVLADLQWTLVVRRQLY